MSFRPCVAKLWSHVARRRVIPILQDADSRQIRSTPFRLGPAINHGVRSHYSTENADPKIINQLREERERLLRALAGHNTSELVFQMRQIRNLFYSFPRPLRPQVSVPYFQLSRIDIESILKRLSKRGRPEDIETLSTILQDSRNIYSVIPDASLIQSVLQALVRAGHPMKAYEYFQFRWWRPNSLHWSIVMNGFAQQGDIEQVRMCLDMMKRSWPFPGNAHYKALLVAMLEGGDPSFSKVKQVVEEMKAFNLPFDTRIEALLMAIARRCSGDEWNDILNTYQTFNKHYYTQEQLQTWITQLADARSKGKKSSSEFEHKFRGFRMQGFVPDERVLARLVQSSATTTPDEVKFLEEVFEVRANLIVWSIVLRNAIEKASLSRAQEVYHAARAAGIKPDAAMVHPLLRALCSGRLREPSEGKLDYAIQIYDDLQAATADTDQLGRNLKVDMNPCPESTIDGSIFSTASAGGAASLCTFNRSGADTAVYNSLLRALAASSNREKYFPIALRLLASMQERCVPLDPMTTASTAVLLIRASRTPEDAAAAYRRVRSIAQPVLDEKGYVAVLHALCSLDPFDAFLSAKTHFVFDDENVDEEAGAAIDMSSALGIFYSPYSDSVLADSIVPRRSLLRWGPEDPNSPATHMHIFFEVVADMRAQGLRPPAGVYTVLASQCGKLATRARELQRRKESTMSFSHKQRTGLRALRMTIVNMLDEVFSRVALGLHVLDAASPPPFLHRDAATQGIRGNSVDFMKSNINNDNAKASAVNSNAIIPDAPLLNALLDAYARAGALSRALRVWRVLRSRDLVTPASASVVFDAIGHNLEAGVRHVRDRVPTTQDRSHFQHRGEGREEGEGGGGIGDGGGGRGKTVWRGVVAGNEGGTARAYAWELADRVFRELLLCAGAPASAVIASGSGARSSLGPTPSASMTARTSTGTMTDNGASNSPSNTASALARTLPLPPSAALLLTPRVWAAWVECLCRLGRLDDAVRVVCYDMLPASPQVHGGEAGRESRNESYEMGQVARDVASETSLSNAQSQRTLNANADVNAMAPAVRVALTFAASVSPDHEAEAREQMRACLPAELSEMQI